MVDYSKWKDIEISDDEDDTHPNIDTPSLFRWRHQARLDRMEESKKEKEKLESEKLENDRKLAMMRSKLKEEDSNSGNVDLSSLRVELAELEKQQLDFERKEAEMAKRERSTPWNVDTITYAEGQSRNAIKTLPVLLERNVLKSSTDFDLQGRHQRNFYNDKRETLTVISKPMPRKESELTDEEREAEQSKFIKKNEKTIKKFGMLRHYEDSKRFLQDNPELVSEYTSNYLVIWCINLEVEEKHELMSHVAHQCICMHFIFELAKHMDIDPKACVSAFFTRIQTADKQYVDGFESELKLFKQRIAERAKTRIEKAMQEAEEEAKKERLGPGGLDPVEVLETLPEELKKCFEEQDIEMLQQVITQLPEDEVRYHMKRCVDSGLWVPDAKKAQQ